MDFKPLHDCYGRQKRNNSKGFKCTFPICRCPLSSMSGVFRDEKIDWIVQQKIKNPSFKHKIKI